MIQRYFQEALEKACEDTPFKPINRLDIHTVGSSRYYDGFVIDTRTGKTYTVGTQSFANQTLEQTLELVKIKINGLESRIVVVR